MSLRWRYLMLPGLAALAGACAVLPLTTKTLPDCGADPEHSRAFGVYRIDLDAGWHEEPSGYGIFFATRDNGHLLTVMSPLAERDLSAQEAAEMRQNLLATLNLSFSPTHCVKPGPGQDWLYQCDAPRVLGGRMLSRAWTNPRGALLVTLAGTQLTSEEGQRFFDQAVRQCISAEQETARAQAREAAQAQAREQARAAPVNNDAPDAKRSDTGIFNLIR